MPAKKKTAKKTADRKSATPTNAVALAARVGRLETILTQFDKEPPTLSDADKLSTRMDALDGKLESAHSRITAHDSIHAAIGAVNARLGAVEKNIGMAVDSTPRDHAHESAKLAQSLRCLTCGAGATRTVLKSAPGTNEQPCGNCNGVMVVTESVEQADGDSN